MNGKEPRGCGSSRVKGAIYMEAGGEGPGVPMNQFIVDPVQPIDTAKLGISPVGVALIEIEGVTHVFDWVGSKHYPNAADFIEEAIRLGVSRRIRASEDFSKLTAQSRLILIHPKAIPLDWVDPSGAPCPTGKHTFGGRPEREAGLLWLLGDPATVTDPKRVSEQPEWAPAPLEQLWGTRTMPAFEYGLQARPEGLKMGPGIIMNVPLERFAVVNDPDDPKSTERALQAATASQLPVTLENQ